MLELAKRAPPKPKERREAKEDDHSRDYFREWDDESRDRIVEEALRNLQSGLDRALHRKPVGVK